MATVIRYCLEGVALIRCTHCVRRVVSGSENAPDACETSRDAEL